MRTLTQPRAGAGPASWDRAVVRLVLMVGPIVGIYLATMIALVVWTTGCGRMLVLGLGLAGLAAIVQVARHSVVMVPHMSALLMSERNQLRLEALLKGYHLRPPMLYEQRALVSLLPSEGTRKLEHVAMQGGPPLNLRIAYTLRPSIPQHTAMLPRPGATGLYLERDMRTIGYIYLASTQPAKWLDVSGNEIEHALREFLGGLQVAQLYDPQGTGLLDPVTFYHKLNAHLATMVEPRLGHMVQVHSVEVLDGDTRALLAWHEHLLQVQQLAQLTRELSPEQTLMMAELFEKLQGTDATRGVDPAYIYMLWAQTAGRGQDAARVPGAVPQGPRPLDPGWPGRPAA